MSDVDCGVVAAVYLVNASIVVKLCVGGGESSTAIGFCPSYTEISFSPRVLNKFGTIYQVCITAVVM